MTEINEVETQNQLKKIKVNDGILQREMRGMGQGKKKGTVWDWSI